MFVITANCILVPLFITDVIIPENTPSGVVNVQIIDDTTPELAEVFSINLDSVELTEDINGGRNFVFLGDSNLIDLPPSLGTNTELEVSILANDDPNGVFSFISPLHRVTEGETAIISIQRTAGTLEAVVVNLTFEDGSATVNSDYLQPTVKQIVFGAEQSSVDILIAILEDITPELFEDFSVSLSLGTPSAGARLGNIVTTTVIIDVSDSPYGEVGFSNQAVAGIVVANPTAEQGPAPISLTVVREFGTTGATDVSDSIDVTILAVTNTIDDVHGDLHIYTNVLCNGTF